MARMNGLLCTGVAIAALATATSPANAQSTLPPPSTVENPATASPPPSSANDVVITGSRIRHNPLDQPAPVVFVDQKDIARTGLNSINDVLQRLPSAGGGLNG